MKTRLLVSFWLLLLVWLVVPQSAIGQQLYPTDSYQYEVAKKNKAIAFQNNKAFTAEAPTLNSAEKTATTFFRTCKEMIPIDSSFLVVPFEVNGTVVPPFYRNDDRSSLSLPLPFNFCFYGQTYNSVFINNNGSISFDAPHGTFVPDSFPTIFYKMIAPFWADVDTRNLQSGLVYYKITATHMIVTWDHVGYYDKHADKKNTFQLIITNGQDTILKPGKNVSFRYDEMQWTTGDIGGINGFSYPAATIGANLGDSVKFIQFGRFAHPGPNYDGPFDSWDGISWLNGRVFEFNVCAPDNIEPIVGNFNYCDTIYSCIGDTVSLDLSFLSPEIDQITSTVITSTNSSGLSITQNTAGKFNEIQGSYIGNQNNVGIQKITFTATDDGTPPASLQVDFIIKVNPFFDTISVLGGEETICPSATTLLIASNGFDNYKWSNNYPSNDSISVPPGDYFVIGRKGNCYVSSDTVSIYALPVIVPQIIGNDSTIICKNDSTLLLVSSAFPKYMWSNGDTTQSAYLNGGFVHVTITDTNGCKVKSPDFIVPHFPVTPLFISGANKVCPGDSISLNASIGFLSYLWNNNLTDSSVLVPAGTYQVTGIDSNSCLSKSANYLLQNFTVLPPIITGAQIHCSGDSVLINVNNTYTSYLWNTLDTLTSIYAQAGNYFVQVVDLNQCKLFSDTILIENYPAQTLNISGNNGYCPGDSALIQAAAGFTNYLWNTGDTSQFVVAFSGSYSLNANDSNGCITSSPNFNVIEYQPQIPSISGNFLICPDDSALLGTNASFFNYLWSNGDTTSSIKVPAGIYTVQTRDSNLCAAFSNQVIVDYHVVNAPQISGNTSCCVNDSALLMVNPIYLQYNWNSGNAGNIALVPPGTYWVETIDSNGCKSTSPNFNLNSYFYQQPVISGNNFYCAGDSTLLAIQPNFVQYTWSNGLNQNTIYANSGSYSATVVDQNNCRFSTSNFIVQLYPIQRPPIIGKSYCCIGDSIFLSSSNAFSNLLWSNGKTTNGIFAPSGNYSLQALDSNNCKSNSLPFIVSNSIPIAEISGAQSVCTNDSSLLILTNTFASYLWSNGSQQASNFAKSGLTTVQVWDSIGCLAEDSVLLNNYPDAIVDFYYEAEQEQSDVLQLQAQIQINGSGVDAYVWTVDGIEIGANENQITYQFPDTGNYQVGLKITTTDGCVESTSKLIRIEKYLLIPNIITPNGDGKNDVFKILHLDVNQSVSLQIFDRWGSTIFNSNSYKNDWDAAEVKDGVYFYNLRLPGEKIRIGSFSIVR